MENSNTPNEQNINQQFNQQFGGAPSGQVPLPNGTTSLVLGIVSCVFGVFWCYWIGSVIAIVCGIIAISMGNSGRKLLSSNGSNNYTTSSINNNNAGRIMGIIGLCLGSLALVFLIIVIIFYTAFASAIFGAAL